MQNPKAWLQIKKAIDSVCIRFDSKWRKRKRLIGSKLIVLFILRIVFSKNSQGYGTTLAELWESIDSLGLKKKKAEPVSASSICEARQKLDESCFQDLNREAIKCFESTCKNGAEKDEFLWFGRRLFAMDGSIINLPSILSTQGYKRSTKHQRHPRALLSCLYRLKCSLPYEFRLDAFCSERKAAAQLLTYLNKGDTIVYDRGYFGYQMFMDHIDKGIDGIFRVHSGSYNEIKEFMKSDCNDEIVTIYPDAKARKCIRKQYRKIVFRPLKVRLLRYKIKENDYFIATTIMEKEITINDFAESYHARWGIEELYKVAKSFIDVEDFHSKSERGVKQEIFASLFLTTLTRLSTIENREENMPEIELKKTAQMRIARRLRLNQPSKQTLSTQSV